MKASLYIRVRIDGRYVTSRPAYTSKGHIREGVAVIGGNAEKHPTATYVLRYGKTWEVVGPKAEVALAALDRKNLELAGKKLGVEIAPGPVAPSATQGRSLSAAMTTYLEEVRLTKKPKTGVNYGISLRYFEQSAKRKNIEEITRLDMLRFSEFLSDKKKQSKRTAYNNFKNVMVFLKSEGIVTGVRKGDWPKFDKADPEIFEQDDLDKLFAVCEPEARLLFEFFLMTGMREQEVAHTFWSDVNFKSKTVKVSAKPQYKWTPKNYKSREIPIPDCLVQRLLEFKQTAKGPLLFPTTGGKPSFGLLDILKVRVKLAGMNPDDWWLHRFRATFATMHLRAGVDLSTLQKWMGHSDLASTMRYLKGAEGAAVQAKVNATFSSFGNG